METGSRPATILDLLEKRLLKPCYSAQEIGEFCLYNKDALLIEIQETRESAE